MLLSVLGDDRRRSGMWAAAALAIAAMLYLHLSAFAGTKVLVPYIGWGPHKPCEACRLNRDSVSGRMVRWDAHAYVHLAADGYEPSGWRRAFFPLYPLLLRLLNATSGLPLAWCGLLVSASCFVAAVLVLYRTLSAEYGEAVAWWAVTFCCCTPMAVFFVAPYPASLFLLTSVVAFDCMRRGRFVASGLAIALAGATRPLGILLAVPYVAEFFVQRPFSAATLRRFLTGAAIAPTGMLAYGAFLALQSGERNPLTVYASNTAEHWGIYMTWPWVTFSDAMTGWLFARGTADNWVNRLKITNDVAYAIASCLLSVWASFRIRASAAAYLVAGTVFILSKHGQDGYAFVSVPRYVSELFPIYVCAGVILAHVSPRLRTALLIASTVLGGLWAAWFARGSWVA